jgi:hypothetical protein
MRFSAVLPITVLCASILSIGAHAADVSSIPSKPIAKKKELLFKDNFKGAVHDKRWHDVVETFAFEKATSRAHKPGIGK